MKNISQPRLLKVAVIGSPNAGKSSLINRIVDKQVSAVSAKVHTTIKSRKGIINRDGAQVIFYDSPGIITSRSAVKYDVPSVVLSEPDRVVGLCDLIALVHDLGNEKSHRALYKHAANLIRENQDKKSILIMNKIDLIRDKGELLELGVRLSQGCLEGKCSFSMSKLRSMPRDELHKLNLSSNLFPDMKTQSTQSCLRDDLEEDANEAKRIADLVGYPNFSMIFSISCHTGAGIDNLTEYLVGEAKAVDSLPYSTDAFADRGDLGLSHEVIRGKVFDYAPGVLPYSVKFKYSHFEVDPTTGELEIGLEIKCPKKLGVAVVGPKGNTVAKIVASSEEELSKLFDREVVLKLKVG